MVLSPQQQAPPPDAALFPARATLVVRAPPSARCTSLQPAAHGGCSNAVVLNGGLGAVTHFETELFIGKMQVVFKLPPELQAPEAAELLHGKKRQMWVMVQGRVKRPISLEDLQYGSWFSRPLRFPAPIILGPALHWLSGRLGSTLHMQLRGDKPHVTGPLCAAVQMLNVSREGKEPDLVTAQEDTRLLFGSNQQGEPMLSSKRKAYFKRAANRAGKMWLPEHVFTIHCYDHSLSYNPFKMSVPPCFNLDMVKVLDGQPIDISLKDTVTGEWVLRFEVWHRRMLAHLQRNKQRILRQQQRRSERRRARGSGGGAPCSDDDEGGDDVIGAIINEVLGGQDDGGTSDAGRDSASDASAGGVLGDVGGPGTRAAHAAIAAHAIVFDGSDCDGPSSDPSDDDDEVALEGRVEEALRVGGLEEQEGLGEMVGDGDGSNSMQRARLVVGPEGAGEVATDGDDSNSMRTSGSGSTDTSTLGLRAD